MQRGRLKLEFIPNNSVRNQTSKKRTKGIIKKANELATLCGVKVCAVINSCDNTEPEFYPSKEGAEEVYAKFMDVLEEERVKKMYSHQRYLQERIQKEGEKARKLHAENREIELREVMFDLLKGKTLMPHHYDDPGFIGELNLFIGEYVNKLTHRTEFLEANGEPVPPNVAVTDASGPVVGDVNPFAVGTEGLVSNPTEVYDHMRQYDGMGKSVTEQAPGGSNDHFHHQNMIHQEPFQYQSPANFYDQSQPGFYDSSQGMNMNHQEPFQYQTPPNFYDQTQPKFYGSSQGINMNLQEPFQYQPPGNLYDQTQPRFYGLNHDQGQSSSQYPNSNQPFTSLLMGQPQQMSDVQEPASVASMDDNNNCYQQLPVTSQMPSTTTTAAADLPGHSINNKGWPTRFGLD